MKPNIMQAKDQPKRKVSTSQAISEALTITIPRLKNENEMMKKVLQLVSDSWRGMNDAFMPPFQKKAIQEVDNILIYLNKKN